jgi:hypothetical protein
MLNNLIADGVGILLTITGILDAYKYHWEASSIRKAKTARGHSRKFINAAILNDIVRIIYLVTFQWDIFLIISSVVAIVCMIEMWWIVYWFYPYRKRKQEKFKRPNLITYMINSVLPNSIRKRL